MIQVSIGRALLLFRVLLLMSVSFAAASAQTTSFTYQGVLAASGSPANGSYDVQFTLWDSASSGTQQPQPTPVTITKNGVGVNNGVFTALLDFTVSAFPGADRFLEIGVRPAGVGSFTTLSPRQQIASTPYAIQTLNAGSADSLSNACVACVQDSHINSVAGSKVTGPIPPASFPSGNGNYIQNTLSVQSSTNFNIDGSGTAGSVNVSQGSASTPSLSFSGNPGTGIFSSGAGALNISTAGANRLQVLANGDTNLTGNLSVNLDQFVGGRFTSASVGIGTTSPTSLLDVRGNLTLEAGGDPTLYTSATSGEKNRYVNVINSPSSPSASGLKAGGVLVGDDYSFANPGKNDLVVKGNVKIGTAQAFTPKLTVVSSGTTTGIYVLGGNTSTTNAGDAISGTGGNSVSGGGGLGVYAAGGGANGFAQGGAGVFATGGANHGDGVSAYGGPGDFGGYGVRGVGGSGTGAKGGDGIYGIGGNGATAGGVGVLGLGGDGPNNTQAQAGWFIGDVRVTGNLSKSTGDFEIDHPLDPANKYLYHSFVESPDMMNIYNGNVKLNERGEAVVQLPDWFGALNKDFRYQLAAIGAPGPNLYIAETVENNRFKIAGGSAGLEVSWQVTGVRQDAYANAHRIQVEVEKPDEDRGSYLHPELFGQPVEKSIQWAHDPRRMRQPTEKGK